MGKQENTIFDMARKTGYVRASKISVKGVSRVTLTTLVRAGKLIRQAPGLYALPDRNITEYESIREISARYPNAVMCLLSALRYHQITTQAPFEVWIAVGFKARKPKPDYPPVRVVRFSDELLEIGVERREISSIEVPITSVARTVADCFRYRNKIGIDVAVEALRDAWTGPSFFCLTKSPVNRIIRSN